MVLDTQMFNTLGVRWLRLKSSSFHIVFAWEYLHRRLH